MNELLSTDAQDRENLLGRITELERQLAEAQAMIRELKGQIEALQRAGKRQATPFARRERVENPKKPGRKQGKGVFKSREKPTVEEVNTTKKAKLSGCPSCGCDLVDGKIIKRYDKAATPFRRVLASDQVSLEIKARLTNLYLHLNPVALRNSIDQKVALLWKLVQ